MSLSPPLTSQAMALAKMAAVYITKPQKEEKCPRSLLVVQVIPTTPQR